MVYIVGGGGGGQIMKIGSSELDFDRNDIRVGVGSTQYPRS